MADLRGRAARSSYDAVVVGSGPNGLAAALTLARAGRSVVVFEAAETPGGGARTTELTLPGFRHDVCSAIHPLAVGSPFFRDLPLEALGVGWIHPPVAVAHPLDDGGAGAIVRSLEETAAALGPDGPAWDHLMRPLAESWEALAPDLLGPVVHLPRHPVRLAGFARHALCAAHDLARRRFRTARARALFAGLAGHSLLPLERRPSAAFGLVLGATAHAVGWPLPRGGAQAIADGLCRLLVASGGEIVAAARVESLEDLPPARAVLLDLTPRQFLALAGARLRGSYRRRLQRYRYGPGVFKLDLALDGPVPWRAEACRRAGTVHVGGTLEEIADAEATVARGAHPERPFVLVAQPSLFDPTRAPAERHTLWAYCHVPWGSPVDMREPILAQIERFAPGLRDRILAVSALDCAALERRNANLVGGDINGGAPDLAQLLARPARALAPYATPLPGVYLCSSSTPPGGGVHGMCGLLAARAALRDDP